MCTLLIESALQALPGDPLGTLDTKFKVTTVYAIATCFIIVALWLAVSALVAAISGRKISASNSCEVMKTQPGKVLDAVSASQIEDIVKDERLDLGPYRFSEPGMLSKETCDSDRAGLTVKKEEAESMVEGVDQGDSEHGPLGVSLS